MIAVGIDISQEKLEVFFSHAPRKKPEIFPNTNEGINAMIEKLPDDAYIVFASDEPYSELLSATLHEKGIESSRNNPGKDLKAAFMLVKAAFKTTFQKTT